MPTLTPYHPLKATHIPPTSSNSLRHASRPLKRPLLS
nr:MAG TPA: hypothetical protein [Caudoviricetes sp.]